MLLADVLERCHRQERTGLLNIAVVQSSLFPLRIYIEKGIISRFSYGPLTGNDCLDFLPYYDLGQADYLDGMRTSRGSGMHVPTEMAIDSIRRMGKSIRMRRWFEGGDSHA